MTFDDIVEGLKALAAHSDAMSQVPSNHGLSIAYAKRANLFRAAAAALLQLHPDALSNEPLTLEELREMDGQPVWIVSSRGSGWCIVQWHGVNKSWMYFSRTGTAEGMTATPITAKDYGDTWVAYRRPPKEEA